MSYRVKPSGNMWVVTNRGATVSNHRKKSRAVSKARSKASRGQQITIHRADGTVQRSVTSR